MAVMMRFARKDMCDRYMDSVNLVGYTVKHCVLYNNFNQLGLVSSMVCGVI